MKNKIDEIKERLLALTKPEALEEWLDQPNKAFGHKIPREMLEQGDTKPIEIMLDRLELGLF